MKFFEHLISEITKRECYGSLFKGFIAVVTLYLVSLMEVTSITLPIEADSYKLKFEVEQELKKELSFNELKCTFDMKSYQQCQLAKYKNEITTKSLDALVAFQILLKILAYILGFLTVLGFIFHSFFHEKKT